jgi:SAM-dependent methyltransferase
MNVKHPGTPFWVPSAALQAHLNRAATGHAGVDWLSHVRAEHLPARVPRTLVLGCGHGFLERALARYAGIGAILATDGDPASVEIAAKAARREGFASIAHARLNLGGDPLPQGPWDLVMAHDVLHHVPDAESVLRAVREALAPGGRFVFWEYTGPARFQHGDAAMEIVERYFRLLPERIRTDPETGHVLWSRGRVDPERLARESPREAAASDTLRPLARRFFARDAELSGGEGLLHPLLSGLEGHFRAGSAEDERLLQVLCAAEEHATSLGILSPLFTVFVGRRPA